MQELEAEVNPLLCCGTRLATALLWHSPGTSALLALVVGGKLQTFGSYFPCVALAPQHPGHESVYSFVGRSLLLPDTHTSLPGLEGLTWGSAHSPRLLGFLWFQHVLVISHFEFPFVSSCGLKALPEV